MLKIRQEQIEILSRERRTFPAQKYVITMRKSFPGVFRFYSDRQLHRWIHDQATYLYELRFDREADISQIIQYFAIFGQQFERCEDPCWGLSILESNEFPAHKKVSMLEYEVHKRLAAGVG